jgi:hypothetical protein
MATKRQLVGSFGEQRVAQECLCPRCKRSRTLVRLPKNFKCADVICDFCGYLAQVKSTRFPNIETVPNTIPGAAWGPQKDRMASAIYFPLFLVLLDASSPASRAAYSIFYLSADLQDPTMFQPRAPLSENARRAGWQGFKYDLRSVRDRFVRIR